MSKVWQLESDYRQNPGKYRLFKTACIAAQTAEFLKGSHVAIEYFGERHNHKFNCSMPLYTAGNSILFAAALTNFVL